MPIPFPLYTPVRHPEKVHEMEIVFNPNIMVGQVLELEREPFIVVGIVNRMGGLPTTKLSVVEPNWVWKFKYKAKRFLRNVFSWITRPLRWLKRKSRG